MNKFVSTIDESGLFQPEYKIEIDERTVWYWRLIAMIRRAILIVETTLFVIISSIAMYAVDDTGISLELGYSSVGGYYSNTLRDTASYGMRIVPFDWNYFFADGALSVSSYQLTKSSYSQLLVGGFDAGFNACYRFQILTPFVGTALGVRSFYFHGKSTGSKLYTFKPEIGARAGVMLKFNERLYAELRSDYSVSSLSGKIFTAYTQSAGFTYRIGIQETPSRIVEVQKTDYYADGLNALNRGDIIGARELLSHVGPKDPGYADAKNLIADINSSLLAYDEGKKSITDNKKVEAIPLLEKASIRIPEAAKLIESIRAELRKEIGPMEKSGIAAYDSNDYTRCITIMRRILQIDPNNQTAKTYLPRAEKREEAIRRLR
jgi:hypothetical protein